MSKVELDANDSAIFIPVVSPEKTLEFSKENCHIYDKVSYAFFAK